MKNCYSSSIISCCILASISHYKTLFGDVVHSISPIHSSTAMFHGVCNYLWRIVVFPRKKTFWKFCLRHRKLGKSSPESSRSLVFVIKCTHTTISDKTFTESQVANWISITFCFKLTCMRVYVQRRHPYFNG